MKNHPLFPIATKLRPELKNLDGSAGLQAFSEVLTVVYLIPFSVVGVVWLIATSGGLPVLEIGRGHKVSDASCFRARLLPTINRLVTK